MVYLFLVCARYERIRQDKRSATETYRNAFELQAETNVLLKSVSDCTSPSLVIAFSFSYRIALLTPPNTHALCVVDKHGQATVTALAWVERLGGKNPL